MSNTVLHPASFKDPAGFIFFHDHTIYRQVNQQGANDYEKLMDSGLYEKLVSQKRLIPHTEINDIKADASIWYKTLQPQPLLFTSYAYEWSFDQLKDAALLTLQIQKEALKFGMGLKDATPFNIQWLNGKAVFIDTLSFEKYEEGEPWVAYKQFCENFLSPLLLVHYRGEAISRLLLSYPQGIPLPLTSSLLPFSSRFKLSIYLHVHLQAKMQRQYKDQTPGRKTNLSQVQLNNILDSLVSLIKKLSPGKNKTTWNNYYEETILSNEYFQQKQKSVSDLLSGISFNSLIDLGANKGEFSLLLKDKAEKIIAADFDAACINDLYLHLKANKIKNIYPLVNDLTSPSPSIGWGNMERAGFWERMNADVIMALALIHHLVISNNICFSMIADLFHRHCQYLLIEFVPKSDPKVQQLLSYRKDVFENYTQENFEASFSGFFNIEKKEMVGHSKRILYLMKTRHTHV